MWFNDKKKRSPGLPGFYVLRSNDQYVACLQLLVDEVLDIDTPIGDDTILNTFAQNTFIALLLVEEI